MSLPRSTCSYSETAEDAAQTVLPPMQLVAVDGAAAAAAVAAGTWRPVEDQPAVDAVITPRPTPDPLPPWLGGHRSH
jgi:hypothetical protein